MEFTISVDYPFSLEYSLESGQAFRWQNTGSWWVGVVAGRVLKMRQEGDLLRCASGSDDVDASFVRDYFKLDVRLEDVMASIMRDENVTKAVQTFYGLRLLRQEKWECLASFVLATNANIPRIRGMIQALCARYGKPLQFEGIEYHEFPGPEALSMAPIPELRECGLGYRAEFLRQVARSVDEGRVDFSELSMMGYEDARAALLRKLPAGKVLPGVGLKVADCALLYSFDMDEAFPIDVWVARAVSKLYPDLARAAVAKTFASPHSKLSARDYERLSARLRSYFGPFAGYAQQYLFMAARSEGTPQGGAPKRTPTSRGR